MEFHLSQALGEFVVDMELAELDRKSLYRTLSEVGNPRLSSLTAILRALGLKLRVEQGEAA